MLTSSRGSTKADITLYKCRLSSIKPLSTILSFIPEKQYIIEHGKANIHSLRSPYWRLWESDRQRTSPKSVPGHFRKPSGQSPHDSESSSKIDNKSVKQED